MQRLTRAMGWVVAMTMMAAAPLQAQDVDVDVLKHVPADVPIAVVTPSLSDAADKVAMLNERLGINNPTLADPLSLAPIMAVREGVNLDGPAALIFLSLPEPQGGQEPEVGVLLPMSDYQAFLGNFNPEGDGEVRAIEYEGERLHLKQVGEYALIAEDRDAVTNFASPGDAAAHLERAGAAGLTAMDGADLFVLVDVQRVAPLMLPQIMEGLMMAQQMGDPEMQPLLEFYGQMVEQVLTSGGGFVYGLRVSEDGVALDSAVQFREGTEAAEALAAGPEQRPTLDRLPDRRYLLAATMDLRTLPLEQWMNDLREVFDGDDEFSAMMRQVLTDSSLNTVNSQTLYEPQLGFNGNIFNGITVALVDDPAAALQALQDDVTALDGIDLGGEMTYRTSYTEQAMQVGGRDVDQYSIQMDVPDELMAEMGPAAMFITQDMGGYAVTTDDALIASQGSDLELLRETLELEGPTLEQNEGIENVRQQLLEMPAVEMYLHAGTLMEMINEFVTMFNPNMELDIPAGLAPIGLSYAFDEGGLGSRAFVPMPVIDAVMRNVQMFTGGGGGQLSQQ